MLAFVYNLVHPLLVSFLLHHLYKHPSPASFPQDATLCWISVTLPAPLLFFLVYLLTFHAWISYQGFSTYEYILWKRLRDRLRAKTKVRCLIFIIYIQTGELSRREFESWVKRTTPRNILQHESGKLKHQFGEGSIHNESPESMVNEPPKLLPPQSLLSFLLCRKHLSTAHSDSPSS